MRALAAAPFQQRFLAALLGGSDAAFSPAAQPAFAVYRNTVLSGCIEALRDNFPSVALLVGKPWFDAAAADFAREHPPSDGRLLLYGAGFADFLQTAAAGHDLPYLSDVARLDRAWIECHTAVDAPVAEPGVLAALTPEALGALCLPPHPAARWRWCADGPALTIWRRHRRDAADVDGAGIADDAALVWQAEGALLTRPQDAVDACAVGQAHCVFLDACAAGAPLAEAAAAAQQAEATADIAALLALLLRTGAVCAPRRLAEGDPRAEDC